MVKSCFLPVADGSILSAAAVLVLLVLARGVVFPCVAGSPIVLDVMLEKFLHDLLLRVTRSLRCFPGAVLTTPGAWAHSRGWDPSSASPRPGLGLTTPSCGQCPFMRPVVLTGGDFAPPSPGRLSLETCLVVTAEEVLLHPVVEDRNAGRRPTARGPPRRRSVPSVSRAAPAPFTEPLNNFYFFFWPEVFFLFKLTHS